MNEIYVIGGELRRSVFRKLAEWQSSKKGVILQINSEKKTSHTCVEYISPAEVCAATLPAVLFKSAFLLENKLFTCTSTEVLVYELPSFRLLHYISLPCFNDLHHVYPTPGGTLLVAVTGLDMVVEVSTTGAVLQQWNVLGEEPWQRFSRDIDYRTIATTKPHHSHPNHIFQLDDEIWVTRFEQRDAVSLTRPGRRIDISIQRPHDGHVLGDSIYFTTVDGHIVLANRKTLRVETTFDLTKMGGPAGQILGWCRGLLFIAEHLVWVGFTRVRPTRFRENLAWAKNGGSYKQLHRETHLGLYDLQRGACLDEIALEPHGIGVVFSLFPAVAGIPESANQPKSTGVSRT
ncbi:MAG TPA: hypothetical protein VGG14_10410 [Candidatus Sulfotelmatobacter sp.]|jgi:hypothetical protein